MRNALAIIGHMVIAVTVVAAVSVISLVAIARVQWPAYPSSNQLHALTTVGQVGCIVGLVCAGLLWRRGRHATRPGCGVGVLVRVRRRHARHAARCDQAVPVRHLRRPAVSHRVPDPAHRQRGPARHDLPGLPPFYPPGWFWIGGRLAALTGTPGWEIFKPWAITSITIAIAVVLVLWCGMIRFEYALIVTTATAAVTLAYCSPSPTPRSSPCCCHRC